MVNWVTLAIIAGFATAVLADSMSWTDKKSGVSFDWSGLQKKDSSPYIVSDPTLNQDDSVVVK
jgi:hypothetical protein